MKTIYKTIAIFLLAGTGVDSAQAQNGSSQTGRCGNVLIMLSSITSIFARQLMKQNKIKWT